MEHEETDLVNSAGAPPTTQTTPVDSLTKPIITGLPDGYIYRVTRYADAILKAAFRKRLKELTSVLEGFRPTVDELRKGGGGRTVFVKRFDDTLAASRDGNAMPWGKRNIELASQIDGKTRYSVRGHEIDMFGRRTEKDPYPGVAVEMEWNNKDPFFDRDLVNFQALHREGAIAVGVIVTRGPELQRLLAPTVRSKDDGLKYGQSTTHWEKLIPRVRLGGGGECPLFLIGIEPSRIDGVGVLEEAAAKLAEAEHIKKNWRGTYERYADAQAEMSRLRQAARELVPPVADETIGEADAEGPTDGAADLS